MSKKWYVVQAHSNLEKKAAILLKERISASDIHDKFGEVMVPTEEVIEMKAGQKRRSERKFYPGYVLVEMEADIAGLQLVRHTPRIIGFVGGNENPTPLTEPEFEKIRQRMQVGVEQSIPKDLYEVGEEIRVIDGPFNDFNGTVEEVNYIKSRLQVVITIFGRKTPVKLAFEQVEKL